MGQWESERRRRRRRREKRTRRRAVDHILGVLTCVYTCVQSSRLQYSCGKREQDQTGTHRALAGIAWCVIPWTESTFSPAGTTLTLGPGSLTGVLKVAARAACAAHHRSIARFIRSITGLRKSCPGKCVRGKGTKIEWVSAGYNLITTPPPRKRENDAYLITQGNTTTTAKQHRDNRRDDPHSWWIPPSA